MLQHYLQSRLHVHIKLDYKVLYKSILLDNTLDPLLEIFPMIGLSDQPFNR
jgi:hypothetical protein